jgi:hypothetical protein
MVYKLYGITKEERKIIKGTLIKIIINYNANLQRYNKFK